MSYIIVLTTVSNDLLAHKITDKLLSSNLAACVSFSPIFSCYKWQGKIERQNEIELHIKTKKEFYKQVEESIKSLHTYELPQIIAIPIINGSSDYLKWIDDTKADK